MLPAYERVMRLGRERKDPILLDIGCCCALCSLVVSAEY
jgi:hypothetical protein